jgi:hypothetical protein
MKIAECRIAGAMTAPRGKAAFDRANVVVESTTTPGTYLQVRAYVGADEIEGKLLAREDWTALVRSAQAIEVAPVDAVSGASFWVLRPGFDGRDAAVEELRTSGALLHDVSRLPDGSFGCLVSEHDTAANKLRGDWTEKAAAEALSWARSGRWERARDAAAQAFVLERTMTPDRIAMLSLAHERCGNVTGAAGYVEMAKRSRGADFAARVVERRADLARQMEDAAPVSEVRPRFEQAIQRANGSAMSAGRGRLKRAATG